METERRQKSGSSAVECRTRSQPSPGSNPLLLPYRGVSLLSQPSKVFARILEKMIKYIVEPQLSENQFGFRQNKGCSDAIVILRQLQVKHIEWNKPLYMAFIDQEKALDRVVRAELWKCLAERGIFGELLRAVQYLYICSQAAVRTREGDTDWF